MPGNGLYWKIGLGILVLILIAFGPIKIVPNAPSSAGISTASIGGMTGAPNTTIRAYYAHLDVDTKLGKVTLCVSMGRHHEFQEVVECSADVQVAVAIDSVNYFGTDHYRVTPALASAIGYDYTADKCFVFWNDRQTPHYVPNPCPAGLKASATYHVRK